MRFAQLNLVTTARKRWAEDTEFGQATVRLMVSVPVGFYFFFAVAVGWIAQGPAVGWVMVLATIYYIGSLVAVWDVVRRPGAYRWRRIGVACLDFPACGIVIGAGGEAALPLFGALLWITVGYGIRYGGRYLVFSTIMALITITIVIAASPYWQSHPFQSAAFVITLIIGPGYAFALIARLQAAHLAAEQANQRKSRFVAQVSHDLRQPIHAISLITARLSDTELTESQAQLLTRIEQSTTGAIQQLQTFLNVTTIEAGLLQPQLAPVDLATLLSEQAEQYMALAQPSGNAVHAAATSLVVLTDSVFITTIIQNLLSNAIKYAPGCDVLIGCRRSGGRIAICVYDRGPGVADQDLPKLTQRYFRASAMHHEIAPSLGLGLSIVKQLADSLGLGVTIQTRRGKGTAIWITGLCEAPRDAQGAALQMPVPGTQLRGLRVVVIEDDLAALAATCELIERWGCVVTGHARPPEQLLDCDVLVSDFEFCRGNTLADQPQLLQYGQPVIVVTGHNRHIVARHMADRCMAILEKPVRAAELRSTLLAAQLAVTRD